MIHNPKYPQPAFFCMTHPSPTPEAVPQGFRFARTSKDGLWGIFIPDSDPLQKASFYRQDSLYKEDTFPKPKQSVGWDWRIVAEERDRQWRNFIRLPGFRLTQLEKQELHHRGLESWGDIPLIRHYSGIGIPILFPGNKILAYQVRKLNPGAGQRYFWFSPKVSNKELIQEVRFCGKIPIGFYGKSDVDTVVICEGYLKACLAHFLHGETTIGLGSHINAGQSYELLKYYLDSMENLEFIYIAPDKDIFTNEIVQKSMVNLESKLREDYPDKAINYLSWDGHDRYDIDEISRDTKLRVMPSSALFHQEAVEAETELVL